MSPTLNHPSQNTRLKERQWHPQGQRFVENLSRIQQVPAILQKMPHPPATIIGNARPAMPRNDASRKRFRRSALMAASQPLGVSTRLVDTYKAAMGELEESDIKKSIVPRDILGEQLTKLFNANPEFRCRPGSIAATRSNVNDDDDDISKFHRPVLSWHNWNVLNRHFHRMSESMRRNGITNAVPFCQNAFRQLFWNSKPVLGMTVLCFGLAVVSLGILTGVVTVTILWSASLLWMVGFHILTFLVDVDDVKKILPEVLRQYTSQLISCLKVIDNLLLQGKQFAGREWNQDDFQFGDAKVAQSTETFLYNLPPPSIKGGKRRALDEEYMSRDYWGHRTTQHVIAIDFCYIMIHEEFLRKEASRRKKALEQTRFAPESSISQRPRYRTSSTQSLEDFGPQIDDLDSSSVGAFQSDEIHPSLVATALGEISKQPAPFQRTSSITNAPNEGFGIARARKSALTSAPFDLETDNTIHQQDIDFSRLDELFSDDSSSSSALPSREMNLSTDGSFESGSTENIGNWMDVGAEIGLKILGSAHVQRAMASKDTAERIKETVEKQLGEKSARNFATAVGIDEEISDDSELSEPEVRQRLSIPVHPIWTSPAAVAANASFSASDFEENSTHSEPPSFPFSGSDQSSESNGKHSKPKSPINRLVGFTKRSGKRGKRKSSKKRIRKRVSLGMSDEDSRNHDSVDRHRLSLDTTVSNERTPRNSEAIEVISGKPVVVTSSTTKKNSFRVPTLLPGVKIVVPIFPIQPSSFPPKQFLNSRFQMATVVSSKRIYVPLSNTRRKKNSGSTNCLSVTVKLDKSFLRNGKFAEMTFRIMDSWGPKFVPKHSKLPLGSCVSTNFGLGVLVGWRVEDDCHVVRSLWQRRGPGSACAYLRRDSIHSTMEAAVGFEVGTPLGTGKVVSYVDGGRDYRSGRFFVEMIDEGRHKGKVLEYNRSDITSCHSARFIPVVELIREAAQYQLQVDSYEAALKEREEIPTQDKPIEAWRSISKYSDIVWKSFLRAIEEDSGFDEGMNHFMTSIIDFLERLDKPDDGSEYVENEEQSVVITATESTASKLSEEKQDSGFWIMNDFFGGIFNRNGKIVTDDDVEGLNIEHIEVEMQKSILVPTGQKSIDLAFSIIRTLMRTVSIARAASADEPELKLGLSICYEFLIFIKTVIKVQQKNISPQSLAVWKRAWEEIVSTFGPVKDRLERIGRGIAERMEKQGRKAKVRLLRFVDTLVQDDSLLFAMEQGDWDRCAKQVEAAMVTSKLIDKENLDHYHKTAQFVYGHFAAASSKNNSGAGPRKLKNLAFVLQLLAAPRKSLLKLFMLDGVLDILERILVRVFSEDEDASRMLAIHASNFYSLRHFRMLKDFTIAGKLWIPLLDAADAEFSWAVSRMPENAKELMSPLSSLFSLCVVQFHKIGQGDLTKDWLDFLLEEEAVSIVHDINMKLILALESFSQDIKEMMVVLPYYASIEDDILNLMDEVDIDEFLKEAAMAIDDAEKLSEFIREKATIAIERFLDYLPKMSIPVEKRDLGDGWVLTCRGEDGGDLTLSDVNIKRENLICQVMGGDTIFFPMLGAEDDGEVDCKSAVSMASSVSIPIERVNVETSILDHIRELLEQAQRYGCWQDGVGGVGQPPTDRYVAAVLRGLPVSAVLNTAIELWRNLEIDDDELLEIAIRDVSYQIELQQEREEAGENLETPIIVRESKYDDYTAPTLPSYMHQFQSARNDSDSFEAQRHRFNPRIDPTVLFLEMKKLTLHLEGFQFRIEKHEDHRTLFDPVFEGCGSLAVQNISIKLSVECVKGRVVKNGGEVPVPLLHLRELEVHLEKVKLRVRDTGADWLLNKVVKSFSDNITKIVASNLKEQVREQLEKALSNVNSYCEVNPDVMLGLLGITMDDLEDRVVWV